MTAANPLLAEWETPFGLPPFAEIETAHFEPAFDAAIAEWRAELEAIATNDAPPDFTNTIMAMELSGETLDRVANVFFNLCASDTDDAMQAVEAKIAPELARHNAEFHMDARLFSRVETLYEARDTLGLDAESLRVLDLYHEAFVRAGAKLGAEDGARMSAIMQRLAALGADFGRNVLADEKDYELVLGADDLDGLPESVREAMAEAAAARGKPGMYVVTALRSSMEPFLQFSTRRDLREAAWRGFVSRGAARPETATAEIMAETIRLRQERAALLGFPTFAAFKLDNQMASTPANVRALLERVWTRARAGAIAERASLGELAAEEGGNFGIEPWDWTHYAEKLRKRSLDLDDSAVKPFLQLDAIIDAAFDTATKLFELRFVERTDVPRHHPDVRVWEVTRPDGSHLGIFLGDYFARPSKRSGAWMSTFRGQHRIGGDGLDEDVRPLVINTMNFSRAPGGRPTLLTFEDARTLFHEFGHGLHGLMSEVTYPRIACTSVARDFVELPSQLFEHWLLRPEVLGIFGRHAETGEAIPQALLDKIRAAQTFNKGCETVQYLSSALVDLELHCLESVPEGFDVSAFEADVLARIGMPEGIAMRHRSPHFGHVFAGDGYSAGYYSYMWSEVMDADAFGAFEEAGDIFDAETAGRLATHIYSAGGRSLPDAAYRAFRGRAPEPDALLRRRGLLDAA